AEGDDPYLLNASAQEQLAWPEDLDSFIEAVDYDEREQSAHRWWPLGRQQPVIVDTLLNGGIPSTALSGVRTNAIAAQRVAGFGDGEIAKHVGASETEARAALQFEQVAAWPNCSGLAAPVLGPGYVRSTMSTSNPHASSSSASSPISRRSG